MTTRQTLPELLARISEDLTEARLNAASRAVREERARADRFRDEASAYREILEDVVESLELLAPPEQVADRPEVIPVAELAEVLGCDADTASVRQALKQVPPGGDRDHWNWVDDAICALAHIAGVDPMQQRDVVLEKVLAAVVPRKDEPQPDADGWYEHDGKSWPVCLPSDEVEVIREATKDPCTEKADEFMWGSPGYHLNVTHWRYADGRDTGGGDS